MLIPHLQRNGEFLNEIFSRFTNLLRHLKEVLATNEGETSHTLNKDEFKFKILYTADQRKGKPENARVDT